MSKISLAVDFILFTIEDNQLKVLLVKRAEEPYQGMFALPGVAVKEDEMLIHAARRCLKEETGIEEKIYMEQLFTWGDNINRDPRNRVVSVSYFALVSRQLLKEHAGQRVLSVSFYDVDWVLSDVVQLAFDHKEIISYGRERLKNKAQYSTIMFHLVDEEFTLPQLQKIYEILIGKKVFKANFRNQVKDLVEDTGKMVKNGAYRPSKIYKKQHTCEEDLYE